MDIIKKVKKRLKVIQAKRVKRTFTKEDKFDYMQKFKLDRHAVVRELVVMYGLNNRIIGDIVGKDDKYISRLRTEAGVNVKQLQEKMIDDVIEITICVLMHGNEL